MRTLNTILKYFHYALALLWATLLIGAYLYDIPYDYFVLHLVTSLIIVTFLLAHGRTPFEAIQDRQTVFNGFKKLPPAKAILVVISTTDKGLIVFVPLKPEKLEGVTPDDVLEGSTFSVE